MAKPWVMTPARKAYYQSKTKTVKAGVKAKNKQMDKAKMRKMKKMGISKSSAKRILVVDRRITRRRVQALRKQEKERRARGM
jgi:hypothetical protein